MTLFVTDATNADITQYSLTSAFDVTSGVAFQGSAATTGQNQPEGITFSPDGTRVFVTGTSGDDVEAFTLNSGIPFDITQGITNVSVTSITDQTQQAQALQFTPVSYTHLTLPTILLV